jgi:hypothetical protein
MSKAKRIIYVNEYRYPDGRIRLDDVYMSKENALAYRTLQCNGEKVTLLRTLEFLELVPITFGEQGKDF